jgi:hypothetical protein
LHLRLRLLWQGLLVLDGLGMKIEHDNVFVHAIPSTCVYLSPQLLVNANNEGEWGVEIVNELR